MVKHYYYIILLCLLNSCMVKEQHPAKENPGPYRLSVDEQKLLMNGDIIMRRGEGMVSDGIARMLQEDIDVTHCGIIYRLRNRIYVIHSLSRDDGVEGILAEPLEAFVAQSRRNSIIVSRYYGEPEQQQAFLSRIFYYKKLNPPFDRGFDIREREKMYCTELVWNAFKDTYGYDIFDDRVVILETPLLKFTPLYNPCSFQLVVNHHAKVSEALAKK